MSTFSAVAAAEAALVEAFKALDFPIQHAVASPPNRNSSADLQCNGALALAKAMGRPPADIANAIAEQLTKGTWFSVVEVAGPVSSTSRCQTPCLTVVSRRNSEALGLASLRRTVRRQ